MNTVVEEKKAGDDPECRVEEILAKDRAKDELLHTWFPDLKEYFKEAQIYRIHKTGKCACGMKTKMERFYEAEALLP